MHRRAALTLLLLLLLWPGPAAAQDDEIRVRASLSQTSISEEDILQLSISVSAPMNLQAIDVKFPTLRDFDKLGEQSSRSFSQFNSQINATISTIYNLYPKRKGVLNIPAIEVIVDGKSYKTEPLTVTVTAGSGNDDIIVRYNPSTRSAFVGEQISLDLELLFKVRIANYDIVDEPKQEGFIVVQDAASNPNATVEETEYEGQTYYRAVLRRQMLFPLSPGDKYLEPTTFRIQYRTTGFDFSTRLATRKTERVRIEVKPLPDGAPADFSGAVGSYKLAWNVDPTSCKTGEPITVKIDLTGAGDIERSPDIKPPLPDGFEIINAATKTDTVNADGLWGGEKHWEYIVIPANAGDYRFGPLTFSFFDPRQKKYDTASVLSVDLHIEQSDRPLRTVVPAQSNTDTSEGDVRYLKSTPGSLARGDGALLGNPFIWLLLAAPPLFNLALFAGRVFGKRANGDAAGLRKRKALNTALAALNKARSRGDSSPGGFEKVRAAIMRYFADKFEKTSPDLSLAEIRSELVRHDLHQNEFYENLERIVEACEASRYAPSAMQGASPGRLAADAMQWLEKLNELI